MKIDITTIKVKRKCSFSDEIPITVCTGSCQNDNLQNSQQRKSQNDEIPISAKNI